MIVSKVINGEYVRLSPPDPGAAERLAAMFASGTPPCCMTDDVFLEGMEARQANEFNGNREIGDFYRGEAVKGGVNPHGKVYMHGLASFPGDPKAWISSRGDVKRVCEEKGLECSGAVTVRGPEPTPPKERYEVADDLVAEHVMRRLEDEPGLHRKDRQEVIEETREQLSPNW